MKEQIVTEFLPNSQISEAYRILRTNISFSKIDKELKTLVVTSASSGEGKSTTCCNLALTMSQVGKKVLLMDCDFRKPSIHEYFKVSNHVGLTTIISEKVPYRECIQTLVTSPKIHVLPAGPIPFNPAELLCSENMDLLIQQLKKEYNILIFDTPPVNSVTDAALLSTKVDGVLLVVASRQTSLKKLNQTKEQLEKVNANIIGAVLTKTKRRTSAEEYPYYSQQRCKK